MSWLREWYERKFAPQSITEKIAGANMMKQLIAQAQGLWPGFSFAQFEAVAYAGATQAQVRVLPTRLESDEFIKRVRAILVIALNDQYGTPDKQLK